MFFLYLCEDDNGRAAEKQDDDEDLHGGFDDVCGRSLVRIAYDGPQCGAPEAGGARNVRIQRKGRISPFAVELYAGTAICRRRAVGRHGRVGRVGVAACRSRDWQGRCRGAASAPRIR